jgi:hypothetical protein
LSEHGKVERGGPLDAYDSAALLALMDITPEQRRMAALTLADHARDAGDLRNLLHTVGLLCDPDVKPRLIY